MAGRKSTGFCGHRYERRRATNRHRHRLSRHSRTLFADGTFEYIPIPDGHSIDERTYGNTVGRHGRNLIDHFPVSMRDRTADQPMHVDPELESFTYGDPTTPQAGLRHLQPGDLLVFYCGLEGRGFAPGPALYLMGFFEVERAGRATGFTKMELKRLFSRSGGNGR